MDGGLLAIRRRAGGDRIEPDEVLAAMCDEMALTAIIEVVQAKCSPKTWE